MARKVSGAATGALVSVKRMDAHAPLPRRHDDVLHLRRHCRHCQPQADCGGRCVNRTRDSSRTRTGGGAMKAYVEPMPLVRSRWLDFVELTKPRIAVMVLFTVAVGALLA